jgi:SulP family sulfate permease
MAEATLLPPPNGLERWLPVLHWRRLLDGPTLRADVVAGITAGVLILPQAVALATLAGMPPEYGLYTAIFPVLIVALFGSSWHALSGPNTALCILLFVDLSSFASRQTEEYIVYAMGLTFMAGVIQLGFGLLRLGGIFNFISHSVIVGMVAGVGIVIIVQQLGNFFGILMNQREELYETAIQVYYNIGHANWYAAAAGTVTVLTGIIIKRINRKWPHLILAVVAGTLAAWLLDGAYGPATTNIDKLGTMTLSVFPFQAVDFSPESLVVYTDLLPSAFLIALLGLMQSAVIARSCAVKSGQQVDMNQEILGQGLSNLVGSYLSCFASCGSFNRSAANQSAGASTPLAGLLSAVALAALVWVAAPLIALMPISVMAGVLFLVGWGLIDAEEIKKLINVREEMIIFVICLAVTVIFGLDYAVFTGVLLSVIAYFRDVSKPTVQKLTAAEAQEYLPDVARDATVLRVTGNLFFGAVTHMERILADLAVAEGRARTLFISAERVPYLDTAAALALAKEAHRRRQAGGQLMLALRDRKTDEVVSDSGLLDEVGAAYLFLHPHITAPFTPFSTPLTEPQA